MRKAKTADSYRALALLLVMIVTSPNGSAASRETEPNAAGESEVLPTLRLRLTPALRAADGQVSHVDVRVKLSEFRPGHDGVLLAIPRVFADVRSVAYETQDISASDEKGPLQLRQSDDPPDVGGFLYWRRWIATRPVVGPVDIRYTAPIGPVVQPRLGAGPPFDLRADAGGFSGAGSIFLIVPQTERAHRIDLNWNLSQLAPGSRAVSSLGLGDITTTGPPQRLLFAFYMAGPLLSHPENPPAGGFSATWLGEPAFDMRSLMQWSEKGFKALSSFFRDESPPPFRVFGRRNPYEAGGGAALSDSYMISYPVKPESPPDSVAGLRETIPHEMVHVWVGGLDGQLGTVSWYGEGMAVHYSRLEMLRAGLISPALFLEDVNAKATRYYTNALNSLPNSEIPGRFWSDTRVRTLAYDRGSFYLADLDAKIRTASKGKRSLDELLFAMLERRRSGTPVNQQTWTDLLIKELGGRARTELEDMLGGRVMVPPSNAYGPCFERRKTTLRQFELGFEQASFAATPRLVKGLVRGSAADRAGLREGDELLHSVSLERTQTDPARTLALRVRRGGETLQVEYLPRGRAVEGFQWARVDSVPDARCAY